MNNIQIAFLNWGLRGNRGSVGKVSPRLRRRLHLGLVNVTKGELGKEQVRAKKEMGKGVTWGTGGRDWGRHQTR